jgi:DNA polymerase-3 subunit gamma/tau
VGKTTAARILAMALNCEHRPAGEAEGEPCGACDSCRRIWSGAANLDVVEIDAASNRGVDDARELRERAMYAASGPERHKVYIIDEAHMLTREAWNALLKVLEEPPPRVVFVFATTEPQKIGNTAAPVLSRVQRFDFRRIGPATIVERLRDVVARECVEAEPDALTLIARVAAGGMRDALSLLDQALAFGDGPVTAARVRDALGLLDDELYAELIEALAERRTDWVFPFVARLVDAGADLAEFVNGVGETLRALLMKRSGAEPRGMTEALRQVVERHADRFTPGDVLRMLHLLQEAETAIRRSANTRLAVEALLLRFTLLDRTVELGEILEALGGQGRPTAVEGGPGGRVMRDRVPARPATPAVPALPVAPVAPVGSLTVDRLVSVWDSIREHLARSRPMVAAALEHVRPAAVEGGEVVLAVSGGEVHQRGLEKNRAEIEAAMAAVVGTVVRLTFRAESRDQAQTPPSGGPGRRLDQQGERDQRLKAYRSKDQGLDAVAEALDLELLD